MNRSFFNVILGGFGATEQNTGGSTKEQRPVKAWSWWYDIFNEKCIFSYIVPEYGMAVAQAQHALKKWWIHWKRMISRYLMPFTQ